MPPKDQAKADVENRFSQHDAHPDNETVRSDCRRLALKFQKTLPDSREKSLALTHLEETMFWANAALVRHPAESSADAPAPPRKAAKKTAAKKASGRKVTRRPRSEPPI